MHFYFATDVVSPAPTGVPAPAAAGDSTAAYLQQQQQELQSKILNILNGSGSGMTQGAQQQPAQAQAQAAAYRGVAAVGRGQPAAAQSPSPLINFDNPSVKKALDSLIQSGPNLLKSLPSSVTQQSQYTASAAGSQRQPAAYPGQTQSQTASGAGQYAGYGGSSGGQFQQQSPAQGQAPMRAQGSGYGAAAPRPSLGARVPQAARPRYWADHGPISKQYWLILKEYFTRSVTTKAAKVKPCVHLGSGIGLTKMQ